MNRIVSLVPGATEVVAAIIDRRDQLVGVSHECDWPTWVREIPAVVRPAVASLPFASPADVDRIVTESAQAGLPLYSVDLDLLKRLAPDGIITQSLCDVCAVSPNELQHAIGSLPVEPALLELSPTHLDDIPKDILRIGDFLGRREAAQSYCEQLLNRFPSPATNATGRPHVLVIEWPDPIWSAGHWAPDMIEWAGGMAVEAVAGEASRRLPWKNIVDADPDVILIACCGYDLERNIGQLAMLERNEGWTSLKAVRERQIYAVDANAYFSRPGPRLFEGAAALATILSGGSSPLFVRLEGA